MCAWCVCYVCEFSVENSLNNDTEENALNRTYSKETNENLDQDLQEFYQYQREMQMQMQLHMQLQLQQQQQQQQQQHQSKRVSTNIRSYRNKPKLSTIKSVAMPQIVASSTEFSTSSNAESSDGPPQIINENTETMTTDTPDIHVDNVASSSSDINIDANNSNSSSMNQNGKGFILTNTLNN